MVYDKNKFKSVSPVLATFNFVDIEEGVGYVSYQGYNSQIVSTKDYHLSRNAFHSDSVETVDTNPGITQGAQKKVFDLDFDTSTFSFPRTIDGIAIINTTAAFLFNSVDNVDVKTICKIYIVNASGETLLGSVESAVYAASSSNSWKSKNFTTPILITNKIVQAGEWIRLTVEVWYFTNSASAASIDCAVGHSPFNIAGNIDSSAQDSDYNQTILNLPFKLDL